MIFLRPLREIVAEPGRKPLAVLIGERRIGVVTARQQDLLKIEWKRRRLQLAPADLVVGCRRYHRIDKALLLAANLSCRVLLVADVRRQRLAKRASFDQLVSRRHAEKPSIDGDHLVPKLIPLRLPGQADFVATPIGWHAPRGRRQALEQPDRQDFTLNGAAGNAGITGANNVIWRKRTAGETQKEQRGRIGKLDRGVAGFEGGPL